MRDPGAGLRRALVAGAFATPPDGAGLVARGGTLLDGAAVAGGVSAVGVAVVDGFCDGGVAGDSGGTGAGAPLPAPGGATFGSVVVLDACGEVVPGVAAVSRRGAVGVDGDGVAALDSGGATGEPGIAAGAVGVLALG